MGDVFHIKTQSKQADAGHVLERQLRQAVGGTYARAPPRVPGGRRAAAAPAKRMNKNCVWFNSKKNVREVLHAG